VHVGYEFQVFLQRHQAVLLPAFIAMGGVLQIFSESVAFVVSGFAYSFNGRIAVGVHQGFDDRDIPPERSVFTSL
jgi:hypothetical protein